MCHNYLLTNNTGRQSDNKELSLPECEEVEFQVEPRMCVLESICYFCLFLGFIMKTGLMQLFLMADECVLVPRRYSKSWQFNKAYLRVKWIPALLVRRNAAATFFFNYCLFACVFGTSWVTAFFSCYSQTACSFTKKGKQYPLNSKLLSHTKLDY